jgi:hypothetical protein
MAARTLEEMIAADPEGTAFALQGFMKTSGTNANVAEWREKIANEDSEIGVAFYDWFKRKGLDDVMVDVDEEQQTIYAASGSSLSFDDWSRAQTAEFEAKMAAFQRDPDSLHRMEADFERLESELGRPPTTAEVVVPLCVEMMGAEYATLVGRALQFGEDVNATLLKTVAEALIGPELSSVDSAATPVTATVDSPGVEL